jgi:hypothetical protein
MNLQHQNQEDQGKDSKLHSFYRLFEFDGTEPGKGLLIFSKKRRRIMYICYSLG